ncbi:MAG: class I SAM-dependent methyltransferase [Pseudomonadota bacterium]
MDLKQTLFLADQWDTSQYALLDSGDGKKLERFGSQTVIRPDPQAFWSPEQPSDTWLADAEFDAKSGDDANSDSDRGNWRLLNPTAPDEWPMEWRGLKFMARRTPFRHLGLFQEHSVHWAFAQDQIKAAGRPIKLLNLFGYTGMMSLAAAQAGAKVTHLDASPKSNGYGKQHAELSGLSDRPIRWIADDAMKFTAREIRRGNTYDAIVLDPPKFGRGTKNETWRFEEDLADLLANVRSLLSDQPLFVILTAYAVRLSHIALAQALAGHMRGLNGRIDMGEMVLPTVGSDRLLPTAICARWMKNVT